MDIDRLQMLANSARTTATRTAENSRPEPGHPTERTGHLGVENRAADQADLEVSGRAPPRLMKKTQATDL